MRKELVAMVMCIFPHQASSQSLAGNDLLTVCNFEDTSYCAAFITGVFAGVNLQISREAYLQSLQLGVEPTHEAYLKFHKSRMLTCLPESVTMNQLIAVVLRYLEDKPEELHLGAGDLVVSAMEQAFPCR